MTCRYECIVRAGRGGVYRPFGGYPPAFRIHHASRPSSRIGRGGKRGDGTMPIVVRATRSTKETKVIAIRGIADNRFKSTRIIAAGYRNVHRNGFDSLDAEGIAELGGEMRKMLSVVGRPYVWYVGTYVEINESFSYLISDLKAVPALDMENRSIREIPTDSIGDVAMGCRAICVSGYRACRHDRTGSDSRRSRSPAISSVPSSPRAGSSASSCVSASMRRIAVTHM